MSVGMPNEIAEARWRRLVPEEVLIVDEATLLRKIEETTAGVGLDIRLPGVIWSLALDGVRARMSNFQHPILNLVGMAAWSSETADAGIERVLARYRADGRLFGWVVGPTTTPADLGQRLVAHGIMRDEDESMWGMVLRRLAAPIRSNPEVDVRRVPVAEFNIHAAMIARAHRFGLTEDAVRPIIRFYEALGDRCATYLAYFSGREEPVAFSTTIFDPDGEVVVLGGSATLAECRGRGVYTSMVAARLREASALGFTTAIIQAVRGTSAPICERLGFEILCPLDVHVWAPGAVASR